MELVAEGPHAGLGHLSRSASLALALRDEGFEPRCFVHGTTSPAERYGIEWEPLEAAAPAGGGVLVVDSYELDPAEAARRWSPRKLVAFHDQGELPEAELVISSQPAAGEREGTLAGLQYACVGPDFWDAPVREPADRVSRILVSTGGGDTAATGATLAGEIATDMPGVKVGAVIAGAELPDGVERIEAPDSMAEALAAADLAVTAGGQTMLEAAALGIPTVAVPVAANQEGQARALADAGAVRMTTVGEALNEVGRLAEDASARRSLSEAARAAVDGKGARRVAGEVASLAGG
jgi:spore coat polysaccharide biosynthesis predicted glycosyltransferase SpsG